MEIFGQKCRTVSKREAPVNIDQVLFYVHPTNHDHFYDGLKSPFFQSSTYAMLTSTRVIIVVLNLMTW